jgi:MFS family permease
MGKILKQLAIYITIFFSYAPYTMVGTFLPNIADSHGVSIFLIGIIFTIDPVISLIISILLGKYTKLLGRKLSFLASSLFSSLSILSICAVEFADFKLLLVLCVISRVFSGLSQGCIMTLTFSLVSSEYPEDIETMIARSEMTVGIGFISGSLLGSLFYELSLFYCLLSLGFLIAALIPLCYLAMGKLKPYETANQKLGYTHFIFKPVIHKQKIILDLGMNIVYLFSMGFMVPNLELHLLSLGLSHTMAAFGFTVFTTSYFICCLVFPRLTRNMNSQVSIMLGALTLGFAYFLLDPVPFIFPRSVYIVAASLVLFGIGQAFIFCIC